MDVAYTPSSASEGLEDLEMAITIYINRQLSRAQI